MKFRLNEGFNSIDVIKVLLSIIKLVSPTAKILMIDPSMIRIHHIRTKRSGNDFSNLCLMSEESHKDLHNRTTHRKPNGTFMSPPDIQKHYDNMESILKDYPDAYRLDGMMNRLTEIVNSIPDDGSSGNMYDMKRRELVGVK